MESHNSPAALPATTARYFAELPTISEHTVFPMQAQITEATTVHHLAVVCRAKPRDRVVLTDGKQSVACAATIQAIYRDSIAVSLDSRLPLEAAAMPPVTLIAGVIKEQRWDSLLKGVTELGIHTIQPVISERSVVRLSESEAGRKQARWQTLLRGAAEQSEGTFVPQMGVPISSVKACLMQCFGAENTPEPLKILLMERGTDRQPLKAVLSTLSKDARRPIVIAIGPEGGWSDNEADAFREAGFILASLGSRILRSETAAMAAVTAVLYESERGNQSSEPNANASTGQPLPQSFPQQHQF